MSGAFRIDPNGFYDDGMLVLGLGLTHTTLATARRKRQLRYARKGRRVLYLGQWVLDWLASSAPSQSASKGAGHG